MLTSPDELLDYVAANRPSRSGNKKDHSVFLLCSLLGCDTPIRES
jgi:hypothetical protein